MKNLHLSSLHYTLNRDEILRLHTACIANKKDLKDLLEERETVTGEVGKGKQNLTKQLHEVELKIKKQLVIIEDKKKTIESNKVIGDPGAISSLASAENLLKEQLESAEDVRGRLKSGALSPDAQNRLLDIKVRKEIVTLIHNMINYLSNYSDYAG